MLQKVKLVEIVLILKSVILAMAPETVKLTFIFI